MMTKLTLLPVDGEPEEREVELAAEPSLSELDAILRPLLDGADLERVRVWYVPGTIGAAPGARATEPGAYRDMFVDEQGAIKNLPMNQDASNIYWSKTLERARPQLNPTKFLWPGVHGPAVLFPERQVWF
jgi:hypothetical protein